MILLLLLCHIVNVLSIFIKDCSEDVLNVVTEYEDLSPIKFD